MTKDEIASIRAAYSAAKQQVELNSQADELNVPRSDMEIVSHYVIPGSGPTKVVIHYYFTLDEVPETRVYFGKHGVHKSVKGNATLDEEFCTRTAQELIGAISLIMNSDY